MPDFSRPEAHLDRTRLDAVVAPIVRAHGGEVVELEWKQEPGGWVLRVFVEKLGSGEANASTLDAGVSLELCAGVARDLSPALDVADIIPHRYHLEVSSPGVERPLRNARDYVRFQGQKAKVRVREPVDGQKVVVGVIEASSDPCLIALREGAKLRTIPLDQVMNGRLVFELTPAARPGKGTKPGKKAGKHPKEDSSPSGSHTQDSTEETQNS